MSSNDDAPSSAELDELVRAVRSHLTVGIDRAREGLALAERTGNEALEQFFHRCLHDLERACGDARRLQRAVSPASSPSNEQPSTAAFAPGDGANDAEVSPEGTRGKPGNWPGF